MKTLLLIFFSSQLWRMHVSSKPVYGADDPKPSHYVHRPHDSVWKHKRWNTPKPRGAVDEGDFHETGKTTATTTTIIILNNDCDYVMYYCMRGFYTGHVCAKTIYHTYETFQHYCEVDYTNCLENYDYYAYSVWDNAQMEEMYVMPN